MNQRRVVITGMGIVSPLGNSREQTWSNLLKGQSAAGPISQFPAQSWPTTFACEVRNFKLPTNSVCAEHRSLLNRPTEFGVAAALEAMEDSGIQNTVEESDLGVCIGAGIGAIGPHKLANLLAGMELDEGLPDLPRRLAQSEDNHIVLQNHPGTLAALLSARWNACGPVTTIHTACASSGQSIGHAYLQIRRGDATAVLAGGADSLAGELLLAGFCLIGALSKRNDDPKRASRPFDRERDGFVASEGAAMMILEEREHALKRGAKIYAEVCGYGETESAYRITDLPPNGRGIVEAINNAVRESGLGLDDIHYINAHGTSTELNDRIESLAIRRVFGSRGHKPMVSSTKSEIGHLISAAGAIEAAFCALTIRDGKVPPSINLENSDCGEDIDFVANSMREFPVHAAMSNSIGFGGTNTSIIVKRVE